MRTTIDLPDEQRARLVELAARRGEKGFSRIIQEAVAQYLERQLGRSERVKGALAVRGSLHGKEGERLAKATRIAREQWR